jgi:hypothetical protein
MRPADIANRSGRCIVAHSAPTYSVDLVLFVNTRGKLDTVADLRGKKMSAVKRMPRT